MNQEKEIIVIGHKNPDTDSICSAIAYANLKRKMTGKTCTPKRAGEVSKETAFALSYFGVDCPQYLSNVRTRVSDMEIKEVPGVDRKISIKQAYSTMKENEASTLCITNQEGVLEGIITISNIAASDMDVYDNRIVSKAKTPYENIVKVLEAKVICGDVSGTFDKGRVTIAANTPERMVDYVAEHDMVIIGNRFESQFFSIEIGASCIILCTNAEPNETIIERAKNKGCIILSSPYDSYTVARLINQSMPVDFFMTQHGILSFSMDDYTDDVKEVMAKERHRYFPVLGENNHYIGQLSKRSFLATEKKQVILVDHNEKNQAVDGVECADILEIIDHHRLGGLESINPVYFRNQPLGCTATIIYQMYQENHMEIDKTTAGLLCSAIISDTLLFRSPTCTPIDKAAGLALAQIAGLDIEKYAIDMFSAGSNLKGKSDGDIFYQDFKRFTVGNSVFGIGQITSLNAVELKDLRTRMSAYTEKEREQHEIDMMFFMLTNILTESTDLICTGQGAEQLIANAFHVKDEDMENVSGQTGIVKLPGVVSRKKQLAPQIMMALQ